MPITEDVNSFSLALYDIGEKACGPNVRAVLVLWLARFL